jgi:hypothetical protein
MCAVVSHRAVQLRRCETPARGFHCEIWALSTEGQGPFGVERAHGLGLP